MKYTFALLFAISGCFMAPCEIDTYTIDAMADYCLAGFGCVDRSTYVFEKVEELRESGWTCNQSAIQNGVRFTCTRCR